MSYIYDVSHLRVKHYGTEVTIRTTYLLTYSMDQSPSWEANQFSASHEIPCILWNPKVQYRVDKCLPPVPILRKYHML